MDNVVTLNQVKPAYEDITKTLRRIADDIDAGKCGKPSTVILVLADQVQHNDGGESIATEIYGMGPKSDFLTMRGLMLTAAMDGAHSE